MVPTFFFFFLNSTARHLGKGVSLYWRIGGAGPANKCEVFKKAIYSALTTYSMILAKSDGLHFPLEVVKGRRANC